MKRFIIAFVILFAVANANAGTIVISGFGGSTITITTTAAIDADLTRLVALANANITAQNVVLAAQTPPGTPLVLYTVETYIRKILQDDLAEFKKQRTAQETVDACAKFQTLSTANKNAIIALTLTSPCP